MIGTARAADAGKQPPPGLPPGIEWEFDLDATLGAYGFANSLYTNPRPDDISGDLGDNWMEGTLKAGVRGSNTLGNGSKVYGSISAIGERTFSSPPPVVGETASSFGAEDLYLGWKSGTSLGLGEDVLDFTVGRSRYRLGHGMLLFDGASEGGSRGGYWTNARQAFEMAVIGRFTPGNHRLEAFYLERDHLPESNSESKLWGANYEYSIGEDTTLGATYMKWSANQLAPQRDGLDVYNLRAYTAPFPSLKQLSFEFEYAKEDNGNLLDSEAWNAQVAYQFDSAWQPKLSYRYAIFEGDDPATPANEAFDGLFTGFYDWGSWWQGEIAGGYFVSNSNLISHRLRVHAKPNEAIGTGLMYYDFRLDVPASAGVTSDEVTREIDWYMDWSLNDHFTLTIVAAIAEPGDAVEQSSGRTDTFYYGLLFVAYRY